MKLIQPIALCLAVAGLLQAHFTFIIPLPGGEVAEMILSETLSKEDTVNPAIAAGARLKIRDAKGNVTDLKMEQDGHRFVMALPGQGARVVYGFVNLGIARRGKDAKPHLLLYYPKTILGSPFDASATVGGEQAVEIVPKGGPGQVKLQLLGRGKPLASAEFTVILPSGEQKKVTTDSEGVAGPFSEHGRYGAWARFWEDKAGEEGGKKYEQLRHYAMVVFDAHAQAAAGKPLPQKTSSFGAVAEGGWLYVYGGHIARTHSYSTDAVSGRFSRLPLGSEGDWQELPGGAALQGMNLAASGGKVCRIGGMQPRNAPGTKADNYSVDEVACYAAASGKWEPLPALPRPRSSHDVAVIGDRLLVTGGWTMRGSEPSVWAKTTLMLDLRNPQAGWKEVAQPFERRALVTAVLDGRMYVIGGITPSGKVSTEVDVFDPAAEQWSKGPALPGNDLNGFAPAAAVHGGKLYASVGDGSLLVLDAKEGRWVQTAQSSPRLAHRMVAVNDGLLIVGGAVKGGNLDLVEKVVVR